MKKIIVALAMVAFAGSAFAVADVMDLPAKNGNVKFNHKAHQAAAGDCKKCHEKAPGKIEGFGKDMAHKSCKGCHQEVGKGPTKCPECHKK